MRAPRRSHVRPLARAPRRALLLLALTAALPACASTGSRAARGEARSDAPGALTMRRGPAEPDVSMRELKGEALARDPMRPLSDVLASLWPLSSRPDPRRTQSRGAQSEVGVYSGNAFVGDWDFLRGVRSGEVARVQRLTSAEAYQRFGRMHANGAVLVTFWPGGRR
jgi:hypothetical protein